MESLNIWQKLHLKKKETINKKRYFNKNYDSDENKKKNENTNLENNIEHNINKYLSSDDESITRKRLKLAKQYIQKIQTEVGDYDFDAKNIDKDLISERLNENIIEHKRKIYLYIADDLEIYEQPSSNFIQGHKLSVTSVDTYENYIYSVSKDGLLQKWDISDINNPKKLAYALGGKRNDESFEGHISEITDVKVSGDGNCVVTCGKDKRIVVRNSSTLNIICTFKHHRGSVLALAFRKGTNQLYSCSSDRTIKFWSLDEMAYIQTLFGHQEAIPDIASLSLERCVSVGSRDRTARLWKIAEESQMIFKREDKKNNESQEGSIDCVTMIDENHFLTGSDNGNICLWSIYKRKPIFTIYCAHGYDSLKSSQYSAELDTSFLPFHKPRWITSLTSLPYSDIFLSGSWDGYIKLWKLSSDLKSFSLITENILPINGIINRLCVTERGKKAENGIRVIAAIGKENRLGRWFKNENAKNGIKFFEIKRLRQKTQT
ncbi:hypothetical protein PNEG_02857 [Pneumocystis murina B123]|uniref:Uncharacterized protein n=1 Tax=Pneumocystis murina (strain B123) TaxID=1069680 RepID=M7P4A2_PNEMU|nr:hypothetical protein PNEG_02857 [Pneumocystis murina B123]EMR08680.1 hypothetical protein PNEG_02857 [Pneumocystis murina B123]